MTRTARKSRQARATAPATAKVREVFVARPFQHLASETDWVALRELVPAASAPLRLTAELVERYGERPVTVATVLPMAWPAMTKKDGRVLIGLQRYLPSADPSQDLAAALLAALQTEPGDQVAVPAQPGPGPRLQDLLTDGALDVTVHDGFEFWLDEEPPDEVKSSLERANASLHPTVKLAAAPAAYWSRMPEKAHVRWVLPDDEEAALRALTRLAADGTLRLGEQTKFAGMFRALGLLIPVWDLPAAAPAPEWEEPLAALAGRYAEALADDTPLSPEQRRARQGLLGRQLTLR
ncbi:MAG: DUF5926 family protein [Micromonosporaceae bacterium]